MAVTATVQPTDADLLAALKRMTPWLVITDRKGVPMVILDHNAHQTDTIVARFAVFSTARDFCDTLPLPFPPCMCVGFCHCKR